MDIDIDKILLSLKEGGIIFLSTVVCLFSFIINPIVGLVYPPIQAFEPAPESVAPAAEINAASTEGVMLSLSSFTGKLQNSASSAVVMFILALAKYQVHADAIPCPQTGEAYNMLIAMNTLIPAAAGC